MRVPFHQNCEKKLYTFFRQKNPYKCGNFGEKNVQSETEKSLEMGKAFILGRTLTGRPVARINLGEVRNPQNVDILDPNLGLFEPHPLTPIYKNPIFYALFC